MKLYTCSTYSLENHGISRLSSAIPRTKSYSLRLSPCLSGRDSTISYAQSIAKVGKVTKILDLWAKEVFPFILPILDTYLVESTTGYNGQTMT